MRRLLCVLLAFYLNPAFSQTQSKVTLRINEWPEYVSMHKEAFEAYAKSKGKLIELQVVKPDITDEQVIFENVRLGKVDVLTPTESFFLTRRKKLLNLVAPVDPAKVPGYEAVPESLRNSPFHIDEGKHYGIVFMAGYYGLYYNSKRVKAPEHWNFLWSPEAKGRYSVSKDTYFVNAYIAQWALDEKNVEKAYDSAKFDRNALGKKMRELAQNAHHLWEGEGNSKEQLESIDYTASWGFELGPDWKLAYPKPGSSMWVDCLAITKEAAKDPKKLEAFYLLASFAVQAEAQKMFEEKLRALPLVSNKPIDLAKFDQKFFWPPLDDRTSNFQMELWKEAMAEKK